jgi:hypothetical protein
VGILKMVYFTRAELEKGIESYADLVETLGAYLMQKENTEDITQRVFERWAVQDRTRLLDDTQCRLWMLRTVYDLCMEEIEETSEEPVKEVTARMASYLHRSECYSVKSVAAFLSIDAMEAENLLEEAKPQQWSPHIVDSPQKKQFFRDALRAQNRHKQRFPVNSQKRRVSYLAATSACIAMVMAGAFLMQILPEKTDLSEASTLTSQEMARLDEQNCVQQGTITLYGMYQAGHQIISEADMIVAEQTDDGMLSICDSYLPEGSAVAAYPFIYGAEGLSGALTITEDGEPVSAEYAVLSVRTEGISFEEEQKQLQQLMVGYALTQETQKELHWVERMEDLMEETKDGQDLLCVALFDVHDGKEITIEREYEMPQEGIAFVLESGIANNITDETKITLRLSAAEDIRCIRSESGWTNISSSKEEQSVTSTFLLPAGCYLFELP